MSTAGTPFRLQDHACRTNARRVGADVASRRESYRAALRALDGDWRPFLLAQSGLPGPRANLELVEAVADEGDERLFRTLAPAEDEFLAACGVVGFGRLAADGHRAFLPLLRAHAGDPRWRVREAVAMGLQRFGDADFDALLAELASWSEGSRLEQRATAAALCEPRLLLEPGRGHRVVALLAELVDSLVGAPDAAERDARVLRQALGYCISIAAVASPASGKALLERLAGSPDADARWIARENLRKSRLRRLDSAWTARTLDMIER
jgi:HEAT repeat protein